MNPGGPTEYKVLQPLILAVCIIVGMMAGYKMNEIPEDSLVDVSKIDGDQKNSSVGRVEELIRYIDSKYIDKIDDDVMIEDAIQAVFKSLDPHSIYISPSEVQDVNTQMNGHYKGIGIENYLIDDTVVISSVLTDSPAERSGLKIFDKIIAINDTVIAGKSLSFDTIRKMLIPETEGAITLDILRNGTPKKFTLIPDDIQISSVHPYLFDSLQTLMVKIDRFGSKTYQEFMLAIETYFEKNSSAKHLILDLRNNPGGYLPEATNILCQLFKEKDKILVYTEGRNRKRNDYKTNGKAFFNIEKIIVLIDENSASASEIVAGAIQDWDRGIIIGRRSFGKGLVQEQFPLNNGGAMRLTVARYYTPSGRSIQRDYSDRPNYETDLDARFLHGDLFNKDSILVHDTATYTSLILNRPMKASGGISPDIFISMDTIYKDPHLFGIQELLSEYTFRYLTKQKLNFERVEDILSWKIPNNYYEGLISFAYEDHAPKRKNFTFHHLDSEVKKMMVKYFFGKDIAQKYFIKVDPFVKKSMNIIQNNILLENLESFSSYN